MSFKVFLLLVALTGAFADQVKFRPCPNGELTPLSIASEDCDSDKCFLRRGRSWNADVAFIPDQDFSTLRVRIFPPFPVLVPGHGIDNGCQRLANGTQCPITSGAKYVWNAYFPNDMTNPAATNVDLRGKQTEKSKN
jgi:ML domain